MSKIFCIGSNKTGTTSMKSALLRLGYTVAPEQISYTFINHQIERDYDSIFNLVDQYDAFEDRPWNHTDFYQILDKQYKGSKFILTIRDVNEWWDSYVKWGELKHLKGHTFYPRVSMECYGVDSFLDHPDRCKKMFIERNNSVINYFIGRSDLLVIDLTKTQNYDQLCNFLGEDKISDPFPHHNMTT